MIKNGRNRLKNAPKTDQKGFEKGLNRLQELVFPGASISDTTVGWDDHPNRLSVTSGPHG